MFYAHFVLAKKGPLARIWLAAHWDKKLTKAHVFETNIESSVEGILQPKVKMALRTSGHLLLGIVRIYSRKAKYLLADCNEAFIKIKMAFRPGAVDLPEENRQAHVNAITLPEVFHDFETGMPDLNNIDMEAAVSLNQSRAEDITIKEDYGNISLIHEDGFGDMGFEDAEMGRDVSNIDEAFDQAFGSTRLGNASVAQDCSSELPPEAEKQDNFEPTGATLGSAGGSLFEPAGLFVDAPLVSVSSMDVHVQEPIPQADESDDDDMYDMGPPSMGGPSSPESSDAPQPEGPPMDLMAPTVSAPPDQTTLIHNEDESFALAPLDATLVQGLERAKAKRKRKLIVDEVKNISGEEMKSQLSDTTDIVTTLDLAPPTKRLMHWKETGGVEKLFALPGRPILSRNLSKLYQRHLTTKAVENEGGEEEESAECDRHDHAKRPRLEGEQYEMASGYPPEGYPEYPGGWAPEYSFPGSVPPVEYSAPFHLGANIMGTPMVQAQEQQMFPHMEPDYRTRSPVDMLQQPTPGMLQQPPPTPGMLQQPPPTPGMLQQPPPTPGMLQQPPPTPGMLQQPPPTPGMLQQQPPTPGVVQQPPPTPVMVAPVSPSQQPTSDEPNEFDALVGHYNAPPVNTVPFEHNQLDEEEEDDYGAPASVGPVEEQQADETYEQFEERILTKRTVHMLHVIRTPLESGRKVRFSDVARNNLRKQVAQKFYTFLVLKKQQAVELSQEAPYAELYVEKGPRYEQSLCT
uniref:Putative sister chromatid cohesion complex cohesin subunit n=1 Tax=Ornithodoros turicata TaxID=34597 RepID=A0A2R5LND8_9ACAR